MDIPTICDCDQPDDSSQPILCIHGSGMLKPYVPCIRVPRKGEYFPITIESEECFILSCESAMYRAQYNRLIGILIETELGDHEIPAT